MTDMRTINSIEPSLEEYVLFVRCDDPIKNYSLFKRVASKLGLKYKAFKTRN